MDVQQLFTSLKKEAECPLCLETVKDPKTLPCLHSFCLRCIDKHAGYAKRKLETTIKCPVCQACFQIPEGDSFGGLPTSFHLNRLVDLLALRDGSEETQRCSSCEDNNTATCYCFVCQNFLCKDCFDAHQRLKATRGHRNVLIKNLQAQDVEELMHRPAMCAKKYHENEPLDYYCQDCSVCICHKCSIVSHNIAAQDIEICNPQRVVYCVNVEAMNILRGLVPGQVFETNTDPSQSSAEGRGLIEAEAGTENNFTVTTRDSKGSQWYYEQDKLTVIIRSQKGEEEETKIDDCKNGSYVVRYKPRSVGLRDISVEVNGQPLTGSPWRVQAIGHQYKAIHSFRSDVTGPEQFGEPDSIAVNERTGKIAIAERLNCRVQLFDRECRFLRTIGGKGPYAKRIKFPFSVEFTTSDEVIVIHGERFKLSKMFLFTEHGDFIKVISQHLIDPCSVSVRDDGHMIVCDSGDNSVKVLSPDGTGLVQSFKGPHASDYPASVVYHENKFFVLYHPCYYVKVFNNEGLYLYDIGKEESCSGQPFCFGNKLTTDSFNNLIVCDNINNDRLQVFSLDGKFINSFNVGIKSSWSVAAFEHNKLLVSGYKKHVIYVLQ